MLCYAVEAPADCYVTQTNPDNGYYATVIIHNFKY